MTAASQDRATRLDIYSQWLADDVDGITFNLANPAGHPVATTILADARERVALALTKLDRAIAEDRASHEELV